MYAVLLKCDDSNKNNNGWIWTFACVESCPSICISVAAYSKPQIARSSVFEDEIATFKEESTPIEFSSATSLSSLTIDDEVKIPNETETHSRLEKASVTDAEQDVHGIETGMLNMTISDDFDGKAKEEQVSDGDEDDEDILAACINMGMQTNR